MELSDQLDHRADIYSLGCSLFRLLTGKTPFAGRGGVPAIVTAHVFEDPPKVTDLAPHLPIGLNDVIAKAMAKNPDARYQTARELAEATTAAIADTTTAVPKSTVTQAWDAAPPADGVTHPAGRPPHVAAKRDRNLGAPAIWAEPTLSVRPCPIPVASSARRTRARSPASSPVPRRAPIADADAAAGEEVAQAAYGHSGRRGGAGGSARRSREFCCCIETIRTTHLIHRRRSPMFMAQPRSPPVPGAVAALGPGDADALLALGIQPVAIASAGGTVPSWIRDELTDEPAVMNFIDTGADRGRQARSYSGHR